jgi:hypothetical protein
MLDAFVVHRPDLRREDAEREARERLAQDGVSDARIAYDAARFASTMSGLILHKR